MSQHDRACSVLKCLMHGVQPRLMFIVIVKMVEDCRYSTRDGAQFNKAV